MNPRILKITLNNNTDTIDTGLFKNRAVVLG
jgi:hypothetical protein